MPHVRREGFGVFLDGLDLLPFCLAHRRRGKFWLACRRPEQWIWLALAGSGWLVPSRRSAGVPLSGIGLQVCPYLALDSILEKRQLGAHPVLRLFFLTRLTEKHSRSLASKNAN